MPLEELIKVHGSGAFPGGTKERTHLPIQEKVRDPGPIPGWGGFPGGRHGNSSFLAWRIRIEEPCRRTPELQRVGGN